MPTTPPVPSSSIVIVPAGLRPRSGTRGRPRRTSAHAREFSRRASGWAHADHLFRSGWTFCPSWATSPSHAASGRRSPLIPEPLAGTYLAALLTGSLARDARGPEPGLRAHRARRVSNGVNLMRHALRNALIPIVTVIGINLGLARGSAVVKRCPCCPAASWSRRSQPRPGHPIHPVRRRHHVL
jgi:hypothetical protein